MAGPTDEQLNGLLAERLLKNEPGLSIARALQLTKGLVDEARKRMRKKMDFGVAIETKGTRPRAYLCNHTLGSCDCGSHRP